MRSLLSLYGLSSDNDRGKLPELAGYQRPIVSRIIRNFDEYGGSMLVASTGLGKPSWPRMQYLTWFRKD
jgi:superfamily II DNA or RNA helicase